ncbi:MBL fold metallo-hydrolase [Ekhidna sp.]
MKSIVSLFLILWFYIPALSQIDVSDTIQTRDGNLTIQPIIHGSLVLTWNNQTIYVDPYGGAERFEGLKEPDIILITDIHGDHLNQKTLESINTERAKFFVPQAVMDKLSEEIKSRATVIENGQTIVFKEMEMLAIPMYNLPEAEDSRHTKGRGNGYVLTLGGKRIYISGDTEDIPEMRNLRKIDVAFICMNLPYTMDINQAASAVIEFKPSIVYPYHYRGKGGLSDINSFKNQVESSGITTEVRLKNWYPE